MNRTIELLKGILDGMSIAHRYDDEDGVLSFTANVADTDVRIVVITDGALLSVRGYLPFTVPVRRRKEATEFAARANYWIRNGAFGIDLETGRMVFSLASPINEESISVEELDALLHREMNHLTYQCQHAMMPLLKLVHGVLRAKQATALYDESRRETSQAARIPRELVNDQTIAVN